MIDFGIFECFKIVGYRSQDQQDRKQQEKYNTKSSKKYQKNVKIMFMYLAEIRIDFDVPKSTNSQQAFQ